jgi:arylsulfatase
MFSRVRGLLAAGSVAALIACGSSTPTAVPSTSSSPAPTPSPTPTPPPNVILVVADDLGYGDLAAYGNPNASMPALDRLAEEGTRFTSFYTPAPVCQPSRAAAMTGRYPVRTGVPWNQADRLSHTELTIADLLRERGYRTAMIGKWHLGFDAVDMPVHYGFDSYFGLPYDSAGFWITDDYTTGETVRLTDNAVRSTAEAVEIIRNHPADAPLFLYVAHRIPHEPHLPSERFADRSLGGVYGDVLEELDWCMGELVRAVRDSSLAGNTLIWFWSDNGPTGLGSSEPLIGGKNSTSEGGVRVPAIAWWPGRIPPNRVVDEITTTMDVLPTLVALAGGSLPQDREFDGMDVSRLLLGEVDRLPGAGIDGRREIVFWLPVWRVPGEAAWTNPAAIRAGKWKYHRWIGALHDLDEDPREEVDLSDRYPDIAAQLDSRLFEIAP